MTSGYFRRSVMRHVARFKCLCCEPVGPSFCWAGFLCCSGDLLHDLGISANLGYLFGGSYKRDDSILGSILGSTYFGKLPFLAAG